MLAAALAGHGKAKHVARKGRAPAPPAIVESTEEE